ncbi:MAG: hypothetical protein WBN68_07890 [Sedimenticolaceae bacterium]
MNLHQACPRRETIWSAIREYRALFRPEQSALLQQQRRLALQVMQTLARFKPRLLGSLVRGDGPLDQIQLLVFADSPEPVIWHLNDRHIPWQAGDTLLHYSAGRRLARPVLRFLAGETSIELIILSDQSASDPPRDPVSGGALDMRDADELSTLIDAQIV